MFAYLAVRVSRPLCSSSRPVRLLILAAQYHPVVGGSEVQTRLLAREFKRRGHEVEVWTRKIESGDAPLELLDRVEVRRLGPVIPLRARFFRRVERLVFMFRLYSDLRSNADRFDLILANQLQYPAVAAILAKRRTSAPVVARVAASGPNSELSRPEWPFRLQRRLLVGHLDAAVALGPVTKGECEAAGFPPARVVVIPNGLESSPVPSPSRSATPPMQVVWLGKLRKEKRPDLAIRAWRAADIPGELVVIGDGDHRADIDALVAHDPGPGTVTLRGLLQDPESELLAAHVYLQTSDTEGMSNALLEAMSAGCACIATDVGETRYVLGGATAEDIPTGCFVRAEAGLLVRPGDVGGMVAALRSLVDPKVREDLGRAAAARGRDNHGIAHVAKRYEDLFANVLGEARRGFTA